LIFCANYGFAVPVMHPAIWEHSGHITRLLSRHWTTGDRSNLVFATISINWRKMPIALGFPSLWIANSVHAGCIMDMSVSMEWIRPIGQYSVPLLQLQIGLHHL
jgi:hypothetical protein